MEDLKNQYKKSGTLHHFHILVGDDSIKENLIDFCSENLIKKGRQNSAIFEYNFDRLLILAAREIISRSLLKAEQGNKQVFIISFNNITEEAQNAFLKIIEEPTKDTFFFFVVPRADFFLPTVLSRAILINDQNKKTRDILKELTPKTLGERIKWADDMAAKISDEKVERSYARELVESLIADLAKTLSKNPENAESLKQLKKIDDYLSDSGSSVKILLEKAVLSLPK